MYPISLKLDIAIYYCYNEIHLNLERYIYSKLYCEIANELSFGN